MADHQVTCIIKPHPLSPHEHIREIGNPQAGWRITVEQAISLIESGGDTFFTIDPTTRKRANVAVVRELGKRPFLRTHADGRWNDNLLALNQCPIR